MSLSSKKLSGLPQAMVATGILALGTVFLSDAQKTTPAQANAADLPSGAMQAKATTACTECHDARIILQQRLSKAAWAKEVDKMVKWGALVEPNDRDALIEYLSTNFTQDQPPYEPFRTSIARKSGEKKSK